MKNISLELATHLAGSLVTLATCWKVTRTDSVIFAATDHDQDLVISGVTYLSTSGYAATDTETSSELNVDNLELAGFLSSPSITEDDLRAGLWDFAQVEIFQVNWADLTQGSISLRKGRLGEVTIERGQFKAELRGLMQAYSRVIGRIDSPSCNADLGDARCKKDLTDFTVTGNIEGVSADGLTIVDSTRTEPGPSGGVAITGISNANPGVVTTATQAFVEGQSVNIAGVIGPDSLNTLTVVRNPTATSFELPVDTTDTAAYPAYVSGGTVTPVDTSGYFDFGKFTITASIETRNVGLTREIKSYVPGQFVLWLPFPYPPLPSDSYQAVAGCGKAFVGDCIGKFANGVNFRGFPYLPGTDKIVQIGRRQ